MTDWFDEMADILTTRKDGTRWTTTTRRAAISKALRNTHNAALEAACEVSRDVRGDRYLEADIRAIKVGNDR